MIELEVHQADVTKLELDSITNAANTRLRHAGGVAAAIARAGGPELQRESTEKAPIGLGEAVETQPPLLPCGKPTSSVAARWRWWLSARAWAAFRSTTLRG